MPSADEFADFGEKRIEIRKFVGARQPDKRIGAQIAPAVQRGFDRFGQRHSPGAGTRCLNPHCTRLITPDQHIIFRVRTRHPAAHRCFDDDAVAAQHEAAASGADQPAHRRQDRLRCPVRQPHLDFGAVVPQFPINPQHLQHQCLRCRVAVCADAASFNSISNAADSLSVIRQLVFDTGKYTLTQLRAALRDNFVGHDALRQEILHHCGHTVVADGGDTLAGC